MKRLIYACVALCAVFVLFSCETQVDSNTWGTTEYYKDFLFKKCPPDTAFFTGTAAEVTPISSIDSRVIGSGKRGPVSHELQGAYFDIVMGKNPKYEHLLTYIN